MYAGGQSPQNSFREGDLISAVEQPHAIFQSTDEDDWLSRRIAKASARLKSACELARIDVRRLQRWKRRDLRRGDPHLPPRENRLALPIFTRPLTEC